jgi:hypothetical protein
MYEAVQTHNDQKTNRDNIQPIGYHSCFYKQTKYVT